MKKIPYTCKFCNCPGETVVDEANALPVVLSRWIPYLACPRCCKFYESKRRVTDRIKAICHALMHARYSQNTEVEAVLRTRLSNRIGEYCETVCDYLGIETVRDEAFLDQTFKNPDLYQRYLNLYFKELHRQFHRKHQTNNIL